MGNSTRRGPSGFFMALLGLCSLALLVVIIYGVATSNPELVKQIMGIQPEAEQGGMYGDYPYVEGMGGMMRSDVTDYVYDDKGMTGDSEGIDASMDSADEAKSDMLPDDVGGEDGNATDSIDGENAAGTDSAAADNPVSSGNATVSGDVVAFG